MSAPAFFACQVGYAVDHGKLREGVEAETLLQGLGVRSEEEVFLVAMVADEVGHVLDDAEHGHVDALEHEDAAGNVDQREGMGRGDDNGAIERGLLDERELDIARAGRHVDDEVIEVAPIGLVEDLLHVSGNHGPAHDGGRIA